MAERLYLRAFRQDDLTFINKLRNSDAFFELTCGNKYFISSEWDRKWIEGKINNNVDQLYLMICKIADDQPIGYFGASDIDFVNKKAQLAGIVISEEFSGKGYATECTGLLLKELFCKLGMNMVYVYIRTDHAASLRHIEKLGFKTMALARGYVYKQNKYHDAYLLGLLKDEFDQLCHGMKGVQ